MKDGRDPLAMEEREHQKLIASWEQESTPGDIPYEPWDPSELGLPEPEEERKPWVELSEADDFDKDGMDYNGYITAKVMIPRDGHTFASGVVKS